MALKGRLPAAPSAAQSGTAMHPAHRAVCDVVAHMHFSAAPAPCPAGALCRSAHQSSLPACRPAGQENVALEPETGRMLGASTGKVAYVMRILTARYDQCWTLSVYCFTARQLHCPLPLLPAAVPPWLPPAHTRRCPARRSACKQAVPRRTAGAAEVGGRAGRCDGRVWDSGAATAGHMRKQRQPPFSPHPAHRHTPHEPTPSPPHLHR